jgi:hypothetical protein
LAFGKRAEQKKQQQQTYFSKVSSEPINDFLEAYLTVHAYRQDAETFSKVVQFQAYPKFQIT